jgi:hypothetical protein
MRASSLINALARRFGGQRTINFDDVLRLNLMVLISGARQWTIPTPRAVTCWHLRAASLRRPLPGRIRPGPRQQASQLDQVAPSRQRPHPEALVPQRSGCRCWSSLALTLWLAEWTPRPSALSSRPHCLFVSQTTQLCKQEQTQHNKGFSPSSEAHRNPQDINVVTSNASKLKTWFC